MFGFSATDTVPVKKSDGIVTDAANNIYATDEANNRIVKFDPNGVFLSSFAVPAPIALAIDGSGNLLIASSAPASAAVIAKYNSAGNHLSDIPFSVRYAYNNSILKRIAITVDHAGNLYVGQLDGSVQKFDSTGKLLSFRYDAPSESNNGLNAISLTVDQNDNLFIGADGGQRPDSVYEHDKTGAYIGQFYTYSVPFDNTGYGSAYNLTPTSIAFNSSGNMLIAGNYYFVTEFAPSNAFLTGHITFTGLAASAIPPQVAVVFRSDDGIPDVVGELSYTAQGDLTVSYLPNRKGVLHFTAPQYLSVNVPVDLTSGQASGINVTLEPGDANGDNSVDSTDFGILIGAYGSSVSVPGSGYDPTADFNGDGSVDSSDFALLIGSYGDTGAP